LGLRTPELVFIHIDAALGRNEPDYEIRSLLKASHGLNIGLDYLPGSTMFDPAAKDRPSPETASLGVWFDAFVQNVDRTPRNANLLNWHRQIYFIDHGAALFFHHNWPSVAAKAASPFPEIGQHILLPWADELGRASVVAHERLSPAVFESILEQVPDDWLTADRDPIEPGKKRVAYLDHLARRLAASTIFEEEAANARKRLV
jgi:hypothetical protein